MADLFRNRGESDNTSIAFVGMSDDTAINTDGYPVDIAAVATQGHYLTPPIAGAIIITPANNRFSISVDGRQSGQLNLDPGTYSLASYARALQNAISNDDVVGQSRTRVVVDGDRIKILSGRFGSSSSIGIVPNGETGQAGVGLIGGETVTGRDVQGTINGVAGEGRGQLLLAPEGSGPAQGLRLFVKTTESQLDPVAAEANVTITKGIASRVTRYLNQVVNPLNGQMRRITENLRDRVENLDEQLGRLNERLASKRERLEGRFQRLESQMSTLRSQQAQMQSQLGGTSSVLPGLPT